MSSSVQRLQLICLIVFCLALSVARCRATIEATSYDILENEWFTLQCDLNTALVTDDIRELGVTVQQCSNSMTMSSDPSAFNLVAAVFGRLTSLRKTMRERFMNNDVAPVFYANDENPFVKDKLVEIVNGNVTSISIRVKATTRTDRVCVFCGQVGDNFGQYTPSQKVSLKIRRAPTASFVLNGNLVEDKTTQVMEMNQTVHLICNTQEFETLVMKLFKNDQFLLSVSNNSLTHKIAQMDRDGAGVYKCDVSTDYPFLVERNLNAASQEMVLAVKFAPVFEVSEVVRYTNVGSQEDIKISVQAYPAAKLECNPDPQLQRSESYNEREFVSEHQLTLSNLDHVQNQTEYDCTASNPIGETKLRILLTARAPTPQILSDETTGWHNSYQLRWQHDKNAKIEFYQVEIVYLSDGKIVNSSKTKFFPTDQKGNMALVDTKSLTGQTEHSGVLFGLNADSQHEIRLQSCNQHGCSEFSSPINVRTPTVKAGSFNDPQNPEKRQIGSEKKATNSSSSASLVVSLFCACTFFLRVKHH